MRLHGADFLQFYKSPMFELGWFGDVADIEKGGAINGRFANISCDPLAWQRRNRIQNPYGFMRSPWNMNNEAVITRSHATFGFNVNIIPDCEDHYKLLQYETFSKFGMDIQYLPHGPVHTLVGGTFGGDDWSMYLSNLDYDYETAQSWGIRSFGAAKDMWRLGILECPKVCSLDTPPQECKCGCPNITQWIEERRSAEVLSKYVHPRFGKAALLQNRRGRDVADDILKLFCNDNADLWPLIGDSLTSSSAFDPTFWPMHPTMDRLFQWRRINGLVDERWDDHTYLHNSDGICWGHQENDVLVWSNLFDNSHHYYTNKELYTLFDPSIDDYIPYIYDNFEWLHCEENGLPVQMV